MAYSLRLQPLLKRPPTLQAGSRLKKNLAYFRINYLVVLLLITVVCMALNPTSLLVLAGLAVGWMYLFVLRATPLVIGGRTIRSDCVVARVVLPQAASGCHADCHSFIIASWSVRWASGQTGRVIAVLSCLSTASGNTGCNAARTSLGLGKCNFLWVEWLVGSACLLKGCCCTVVGLPSCCTAM